MKTVTALKTDPEQWRADNKAALETVLAEMRQAKAEGNDKPAKRRPWQYANSNFGMGL
jgi:hypothetical protein